MATRFKAVSCHNHCGTAHAIKRTSARAESASGLFGALSRFCCLFLFLTLFGALLCKFLGCHDYSMQATMRQLIGRDILLARQDSNHDWRRVSISCSYRTDLMVLHLDNFRHSNEA
jgi:hypothetical protein